MHSKIMMKSVGYGFACIVGANLIFGLPSVVILGCSLFALIVAIGDFLEIDGWNKTAKIIFVSSIPFAILSTIVIIGSFKNTSLWNDSASLLALGIYFLTISKKP
jgi:hypothetical protein